MSAIRKVYRRAEKCPLFKLPEVLRKTLNRSLRRSTERGDFRAQRVGRRVRKSGLRVLARLSTSTSHRACANSENVENRWALVTAQIASASGIGTSKPLMEKDALADLLLVDGDPLANIKLIEDPAKNFLLIMKDGKIYKDLVATD